MPDDSQQVIIDKVTAATSVMAGAKVFINGQAQRLRDLAQQASNFTELKTAVLKEAGDLDAATTDLSQALIDNTPASGEGDSEGGAGEGGSGGAPGFRR